MYNVQTNTYTGGGTHLKKKKQGYNYIVHVAVNVARANAGLLCMIIVYNLLHRMM